MHVNQIASMVQEHWDVGRVLRVEQFQNGVTNLNFKVVCDVAGTSRLYVLKRYEVRTKCGAVDCEHEFMKHVEKKSKGMTAVPLPTRSGTTYISLTDEDGKYFWALFSYLPGKDKYTWIFNDVSDVALLSAGQALAKFHGWGNGFRPPEEMATIIALDRLNDMKEEMHARVLELEKAGRHRKFTTFFLENEGFISQQISLCTDAYGAHQSQLPECFIHQDINPGNMMFDENDQVCAVFDLDCVAKGKRLYDVAWMGQQMLSSWKEEALGHIDLTRLTLYLRAYNGATKLYAEALGPLTEAEITFYPYMTLITELIVIRDFVDLVYTNRDNNDIQYYFYLYRYICIIKDTLLHFEAMKEAARAARL